MKFTNILLILLIGIILFKDSVPISHKDIPITEQKKEHKAISIKPIPIQQYKSITPKVLEDKNDWKHSTTFRSYMDSDSRTTIGVHHNIRIGKDYFVSGGITSRQSSYGEKEIGANISLTKYW